MSVCISGAGEYSSHVLGSNYVCTYCGVLDDDALVAELNRLRRELDDARSQIKADEAGYDQVRAELKAAEITSRTNRLRHTELFAECERLEAAFERLRTNPIPVGVFFKPQDIIIVRNDGTYGEIIGYRYEPLGSEF